MNKVNRPLYLLFFISVAVSIFIHFRGATEPEVALYWNAQQAGIVADVDRAPERLWDWSDPQFLRGLRAANTLVAPKSIVITAEQGETARQVLTLRVSNSGDRTLLWEARVPFRIDSDTLYASTPGLSSRELSWTVDTAGYDVGVHSLGAIYITGRSENGKAVKNNPVVIPVTVEINPAISPVEEKRLPDLADHRIFLPVISGVQTDRDLLALPVDIEINGEPQSLLSDQVKALYGTGWYDVETADDFSWRWAMSPSDLYIYSPSQRSIRIESMPVVLSNVGVSESPSEPESLNIHINNKTTVSQLVRVEQPFSIEAELERGWNIISIELESGNFRPSDIDPSNGDMRQLSFALSRINLIVE